MLDAEDIAFGILEVVGFLTGELLLYVVSLGRHKPRWDFYERQPTVEGTLYYCGSTWFGFIFWAALVATIVLWVVS